MIQAIILKLRIKTKDDNRAITTIPIYQMMRHFVKPNINQLISKT